MSERSGGTDYAGGLTSDDDIALAPLKVPEHRVKCVRRIGDEDDLVQLGPDELGNGLPGK